jgi:hypothetical protein
MFGSNAGEPFQAGQFTVSRDLSDTSISVPFGFSGTATYLTDCAATPMASVQFAPGQTLVQIIINPIDDQVAEPTESITVTLITGAGYVVSVPIATITITSDE